MIGLTCELSCTEDSSWIRHRWQRRGMGWGWCLDQRPAVAATPGPKTEWAQNAICCCTDFFHGFDSTVSAPMERPT